MARTAGTDVHMTFPVREWLPSGWTYTRSVDVPRVSFCALTREVHFRAREREYVP